MVRAACSDIDGFIERDAGGSSLRRGRRGLPSSALRRKWQKYQQGNQRPPSTGPRLHVHCFLLLRTVGLSVLHPGELKRRKNRASPDKENWNTKALVGKKRQDEGN
jgi:hypothetical protein